jgi:hypothetical protein
MRCMLIICLPFERRETYCFSLIFSSASASPNKKILFKKQLFDLEVKGQGPTKVIMVHNTPPYDHAPTYQISLTYLERQKSYGRDKLRWEEAEEEEEEEEAEAEEKIRLKQYVSLRSKGRHIINKYFLVRAITILSFEIDQWYLVCGCMTIRRCVAYRNDLHGTLTFDVNVK